MKTKFNNFLEKFDKKRFMFVAKLTFIFAAVFTIVNLVGRTYTRYESNVDINANANVAFFIIDQGTYESTISLDGLVPSADPIYYTFYVANYKDTKRTKVDMNYKIKFETTLSSGFPLICSNTSANAFEYILSLFALTLYPRFHKNLLSSCILS